MKKLATLLLAFSLAGCVNAAFVDGVDAAVGVIGPEYRAYVKADKGISDATKSIRLDTLDKLDALIREAKKK